jgi:predicted SAM-dependent methyltransferase
MPVAGASAFPAEGMMENTRIFSSASPAAPREPLRLDLGAGEISPPGFIPLGLRHGSAVYPLACADGSVDEIRASHVLEHFPHGQVGQVVKHWAAKLRPGGRLRIAVPDFEKVAEDYVSGRQTNVQGYVMGGQEDAADFHKSIFDERALKQLLAEAGLLLIRRWTSELGDSAGLPVSLNLEGTRPHQPDLGVSAVMSTPRLGFMDTMFCAQESLPGLKIRLRRFTGAYWGQCLERCIEKVIADDNPDAILTLDYDSVFVRGDVSLLMQLLMVHPEADAIAPVQASRFRDLPLFTAASDDGRPVSQVRSAVFGEDLWPGLGTAHLGLTLLRTDKLLALPKPWFHDVPAPDGTWNEGHVDADIDFWRKWREAGHSLCLANRVAIGHLVEMIAWPGEDLRVIYQPAREWRETGKPEGVWS